MLVTMRWLCLKLGECQDALVVSASHPHVLGRAHTTWMLPRLLNPRYPEGMVLKSFLNRGGSLINHQTAFRGQLYAGASLT